MIITRITLGVIAMLVSFYYSWLFIVGSADTTTAFLISAAFVIVTEGAKIILFADGTYHLKHGNKEWGLFALGISGLLIMYSITATAFNFTVNTEPYRQANILLDKALVKLDTVRTDIDSAKFYIEQCEHSSFKDNCVNTQTSQLVVLKQREIETLADIKQMQNETGAAAFWQYIGNEKTQILFHFSRGILLELLGLILLSSGLMQVRISKGVHLSIPDLWQRVWPTQLGTDTSTRKETKSINEWVNELRKQGIETPTIDYLKGLGMGQDKAQKIKAALVLGKV